jgi:hypothetical protein
VDSKHLKAKVTYVANFIWYMPNSTVVKEKEKKQHE